MGRTSTPHLIRLHLRDLERRGLADGTIDRRRTALECIAADMHPRHLLDLDTASIEAFLDARPIGARTRYHWLSNLHCFYSWATLHGYTDLDPTARIIRPKLPRLLPRPITDTDLAAAIDAAPPMMRAWLTLAAYDGLRCAEIAGLHTGDVLFADRLLLIRGKGGRERLIPMHPRVQAELAAMALPRSGPVFRRPRGSPFPAAMVSREVAVYLDGLGVNATAHQLRHWFATRAYQACTDLRAVQELLGHANTATTAIYTAWAPGAARSAVDAIR